MTPNIPNILGKRLKSDQAVIMYYKFPPEYDIGGSPEQKTLPAGKPSPPIESYINVGKGYYAVGDNDVGNYFIRDENVEVVSGESSDDSNIFEEVISGVRDWYINKNNRYAQEEKHIKKGLEAGSATFDSIFNIDNIDRLLKLGVIAIAILVGIKIFGLLQN